VNDLVLDVKEDLIGCTIYTSIIEIHGDFCFTKCGSSGSVEAKRDILKKIRADLKPYNCSTMDASLICLQPG
jgi:hypothetical protein